MKMALCFLSAVLGLLAVSVATPAFATEVVPANIAELIREADVAFTGMCIDLKTECADFWAKGESDGNAGRKILVTTYTFHIPPEPDGAVIKGNITADKFVFIQWGGTPDEARALGCPSPAMGMPVYEKDKKYTLFLTKESELKVKTKDAQQGLRAPVGLGSGQFSIITINGKEKAVNAIGNRHLFVNLPKTKAMTRALGAASIAPENPPSSGPVDYDSFIRMVRELKKGE